MSYILVTGGAGFIGSHIVDRLISRGDFTVILDNLSSPAGDYYKQLTENKRVKLIKGDIRDAETVLKACLNVREILHFAADPRVDASAANPIENFMINTLGTLNILEAARKTDVEKIIFASSGGTLYGDAEIIPTPESAPLKPVSCYGASKASCEMYCSAYAQSYGLNIISCRFANIYGPRSTHGVIYDFYNKLIKNPRELEILGDGRQRKSYLYIDDCVDAVLHLEKQNIKGFDFFNIGSEEWITVKEIADIIVDILGLKNVKYLFTGGRGGWVGDIPRMLLDIEKIKRLGWKPKITIVEGIKKFINYLHG
ncbi:MAG: SDR family NAD(P)-dependent oxidoreductase [Candidatus Odinarchaeum yellowstonii]|uniref:SDR family NAD(P)-dependent oxidoreductase n=1 Tax=Odinarchaeota yellowstonii (strain LCB_4) TaxID=1841599 RepID=A0AAF0D1J4_ODILC|nr:MAG: SDR family NAD(P)-dependent oxidoreductase [Candidatus Odinarchaeum yellowstonii]